MDKTIVVSVETVKRDPKYRKQYMTRNTFKVHDPKNEFHVGDRVEFVETRPLSRDKRWKVLTKLN